LKLSLSDFAYLLANKSQVQALLLPLQAVFAMLSMTEINIIKSCCSRFVRSFPDSGYLGFHDDEGSPWHERDSADFTAPHSPMTLT